MSDPFTDLKNALAGATGIDPTLCGILLGAALTIVLLIALEFILNPKGTNDKTLLISAGIGIAISSAVGWFPLWIPIFIVLIIALVIFNPFGSGRPSG